MLRKLALATAFTTLSLPALAQWELDSAHSSLYFVSIKNDSIAETHHFDSLVGYVGQDGQVSLTIDLNSVNTSIEVRDGRMKEMLFDTANFPTASVVAAVDPAILAEVAKGATIATEVPVKLSLHGIDKELSVPVTIFSDGSSMRVMTPHPVLVRADDYGLVDGINALREVAGLNAISTAVPVSFSLSFKGAAED